MSGRGQLRFGCRSAARPSVARGPLRVRARVALLSTALSAVQASVALADSRSTPSPEAATDADVAYCLSRCAATIVEKPTFSAWAHGPCRDALLKIDRPQVVVVGIEAHVCVQQTALDLRSRDYDVFVCADAVGSRGRVDYDCALNRMRQAGVYVTTVESVLFEWCHRCDTPEFKEMLEVIKSMPPPSD